MPYPGTRRAFTLIELLVVISIIALLIGILLPALGSARDSARAIQCAANARSVSQAMNIYTTDSQDFFPPSYVYPENAWNGSGTPAAQWNWDDQVGSDPSVGYVHWSYHLFANGSVNEEAFQCPEMENGGLPATNPRDDAKHRDQNQGGGSGIDRQARWMAYTANEALIPRNKFVGTSARHNQLVRASIVANISNTIITTEFVDNYAAITDNNGISKSHRPIMPFWTAVGNFGNPTGWGAIGGGLWAYNIGNSDLGLQPYEQIMDPTNVGVITNKPVNAIGRHHPGGSGGVGGEGTANFAFADTHVERMTVRESLQDEKWGERFYGLSELKSGDTRIRSKND